MKSRYKSEKGRKRIQESYDKLLNLWGVPVDESDIPTTYGTTHVITAGDPASPPLMLLHGVGDDSAIMWICNAKELAAHFRLYAIDTIGGPGKSEPNETYFSNFDETTWLDEVIGGLNIPGTDVVGVSMGSAMALHYSVRRPDKVGKIVFLAAGVGSGASMLKFLPAILFPTQKNIRNLMITLCGSNCSPLIENPLLMEHWANLLKYFQNTTMMKHKLPKLKDVDPGFLGSRSLWRLGREDGLADMEKSIEWFRKNRLPYSIVEDAGHAINHQQPERINREIVDFLLPAPTGSRISC